MPTTTELTIEDLYTITQKAELVHGAIHTMSPTGVGPGYAADEIFAALRIYSKRTGKGLVVGNNKGFRINLPHRKSFSPDAAFYVGQASGMRFFEGAPILAVEVRSEDDYGPQAEQAIAAKRADYFAAGTEVVWDVDIQSKDVVRMYQVSAPDVPAINRRGETAEAEPAVPSWSMPVDDLFL